MGKLYNIGDKVFTVSREFENKNCYNSELIWRVRGVEKQLVIDDVILRKPEDKVEIYYKIDCVYIEEKDVFMNLDKAEKECERRNDGGEI